MSTMSTIQPQLLLLLLCVCLWWGVYVCACCPAVLNFLHITDEAQSQSNYPCNKVTCMSAKSKAPSGA
jgi:hypothetical protein